MAEELAGRFRRWFEYEKDAHAKVIRSLETVPADRRSSAEYRRAVGLLGHLVMARRLWLGRFGAAPILTAPLFPEGAALPAVITQWQQVESLWTEYLAQLTDADLRELGVRSLGHRKKLLTAIAARGTTVPSVVVPRRTLSGPLNTRAWTPAGSATASKTSWLNCLGIRGITAARSPC